MRNSIYPGTHVKKEKEALLYLRQSQAEPTVAAGTADGVEVQNGLALSSQLLEADCRLRSQTSHLSPSAWLPQRLKKRSSSSFCSENIISLVVYVCCLISGLHNMVSFPSLPVFVFKHSYLNVYLCCFILQTLPCLLSLSLPAPLLVVTQDIYNTSSSDDPRDHQEPLTAPSNNRGGTRLLTVQMKSPALRVRCVFPTTPPYQHGHFMHTSSRCLPCSCSEPLASAPPFLRLLQVSPQHRAVQEFPV